MTWGQVMEERKAMKTRLLITTAVGLALSTAAYAQTQPSSTNEKKQQAQTAPANPTAQQQAPSSNAPANSTAQQQPSTSSTQQSAQTSNTNVNASVNINEQQRTRLSQTFARLDVKPLTNVNFNVSV